MNLDATECSAMEDAINMQMASFHEHHIHVPPCISAVAANALQQIEQRAVAIDAMLDGRTDHVSPPLPTLAVAILRTFELISKTHELFPACITAITRSEYTYTIKTDDKPIRFSISSEQNCCEQFGITAPSTDNLVGATMYYAECLERNVTDDDLGTTFIDIVLYTDRGSFLFTLFNCHNGYYPHDYSVLINGNITSGRI